MPGSGLQLLPLPQDEASYKLCKVKRQQFGKGGVPYIVTHDGRTIRYPDPDIKAGHAHICLQQRGQSLLAGCMSGTRVAAVGHALWHALCCTLRLCWLCTLCVHAQRLLLTPRPSVRGHDPPSRRCS